MSSKAVKIKAKLNKWYLSNLKVLHSKVKVYVAQSCPTLCDPVDCSPPGFLSMEFSRQEYWSRLPFLSPGDLPNPGIEPGFLALQADSLPSEPPKEIINKTKKLPVDLEEVFANSVTDKSLISKIHKQFVQLNNQTTTKKGNQKMGRRPK